jgi:hypothetical protein
MKDEWCSSELDGSALLWCGGEIVLGLTSRVLCGLQWMRSYRQSRGWRVR